MKRSIAALLLVLFAPLVSAQDFYALHDQYKGVYVTPALPGWGFAADIQKGILFVAVFGYDQAGDPTFFTLQSEKVSAEIPFNFSGTVFVTDIAGRRTQDVGTFTWNNTEINGQPGGILNADSTVLNTTNLFLSRFGFVEDDPLDVMEGKTIGLLLTDTLPGEFAFATQTGNFLEFSSPRSTFDDGTPFLPGVALDENVSAGFYYNPNQARYELVIVSGDDVVGYFFDTVSHTNLSGNAFVVDANGQQSARVFGVGVYIVELVNPPMRKRRDDDHRTLQAAYDRIQMGSGSQGQH